MKNARDGWNAAQLANERPSPKPRAIHGPVGQKLDQYQANIVGQGESAHYAGELFAGIDGSYEPACCTDCGYHVCSCDRTPAPPAKQKTGFRPWALEQMALGHTLRLIGGQVLYRILDGRVQRRPPGADWTDSRFCLTMWKDSAHSCPNVWELVEIQVIT